MTIEAPEASDSPAADPAKSADPPSSPRRVPRGMVVAGVVLATLALAASVVFGGLWWSAKQNDSSGVVAAREDVLRVARQGAINFTTQDYRTVQQGLDRWKDSVTADLYGQLVKGTDAFAQEVRQAKAVTAGVVRDAAVTALDPDVGCATVMVVVDVTVTPSGGRAQTKRLPLQEELIRDDGWKLSALGQVPLGAAGQ